MDKTVKDNKWKEKNDDGKESGQKNISACAKKENQICTSKSPKAFSRPEESKETQHF